MVTVVVDFKYAALCTLQALKARFLYERKYDFL